MRSGTRLGQRPLCESGLAPPNVMKLVPDVPQLVRVSQRLAAYHKYPILGTILYVSSDDSRLVVRIGVISRVLMEQSTQRLNGVSLRRRLVVAVALDACEAEGNSARIAR